MTEIRPYDDANVFAKILRGELPKVAIFEDQETLAFMDIYPQTEGHALVIPKQARAASILDAQPQALTPLIRSVQRLARAVDKALQPDGLRIVQFNGAAAGQTVFHLHFHVIPVYAGRAERAHVAGAKADADRLADLARKIAAALD
jgi:histidine triad (HIT) family protein